MEITREIIQEEISNMEKHYKKLEELFTTKPIPESKQIDETIERLKQFKYHKKYPDLTSKYSELGKYHDKTIYIFTVSNFPYDKNEIKNIFEETSQKLVNEKKIALCRINETSAEWENVKSNKNVCLYVGSSKNIRQRLKEHLFLCNPNTYAMHLEKWFNTNLPITINIWDFYGFLNGENSEYLQNIEDLLWNKYKPLFGRQGKK